MTNLYVGNLSYDSSEENVRAFFEQVGEVGKVNIIKDRDTGRPRGFAFVEVGDGDKAISELNGSELDSRKLTISIARPKTERKDGGGRGRGDYDRR